MHPAHRGHPGRVQQLYELRYDNNVLRAPVIAVVGVSRARTAAPAPELRQQRRPCMALPRSTHTHTPRYFAASGSPHQCVAIRQRTAPMRCTHAAAPAYFRGHTPRNGCALAALESRTESNTPLPPPNPFKKRRQYATLAGALGGDLYVRARALVPAPLEAYAQGAEDVATAVVAPLASIALDAAEEALAAADARVRTRGLALCGGGSDYYYYYGPSGRRHAVYSSAATM